MIVAVVLMGLVAAAADVEFDAATKAVFATKCAGCHGKAGGLDLTSAGALLKGGASGPAIVPGFAAKSLLIDKIVTGQMPPGKMPKLKDAEIDQVRAWINQQKAVPVVETAHVREQDARAVIQARCVMCHGGLRKEGGLDLRTVASRLKGGKSGPALVPGKPEESLMYKRIANGTMPPDAMAKELAVELPTDAETEKIKAWIAAGAPEPQTVAVASDAKVADGAAKFWSLIPPQRGKVPANGEKNPIDAFVVAKLQEKGLKLAPEADKLSLLRRVYLDLTGVPPTKADITAYLNDKAPGAYERVVDKLLASPQYGERWGQHWLDLAGYADSEGFGQDDGVRPFAWRYRDYVIRALNVDKPYSEFLTEQIAGDEMSNDWRSAKTASQAMVDRLAATGFLRTVPDPTNSNERGLLAERMNVVADEVEVLASSVMGMTVGCARCHNHKYDPIPQRDYYRLSSILQAAYDPYEWRSPNKREQAMALESEWKAYQDHNAPLEAEAKTVKAEIDKLLEPVRKETGKKDREILRENAELREQVEPLQRKQQEIRRKMQQAPHVRILADNEEPSMHYLLRRGDPVGFGDPVDAGVLTVFEQVPGLARYEAKAPYAGTSGRRLGLAQWLTQPNHPLTARVAVNQMWMRHFGRGIVPTVANFGRTGIAPSNQPLLDWLAVEFVESGWKMKAMHKLMVTSKAYRQTSKVDETVLKADPENALVSRMPMRRMDADTLFDSLASAAGYLDTTAFGKPAEVTVTADKEVIVKPGPKGYRRNIYVLHRRQTPVSLMDSFDQPPMTPNCTERRQSNVATQALHMMNGSMAWDLAQYMAGRVIDESEGDRAKIVENVYLRAYARYPKPEEVKLGTAAIADFRKGWPVKLEDTNTAAPRAATAEWMAVANYCHAILNSAEFSFID